MSRFYRVAYAIGFTPWETQGSARSTTFDSWSMLSVGQGGRCSRRTAVRGGIAD